jgi:N-acetylglutamate synthase-like GNAT family acetyltransferase
MLIRESAAADFDAMLAIINEAAEAYRGVIPADRWHEPYMSTDELTLEITTGGIAFWIAEVDGRVAGVMGMQDKGDVTLVRHAYVARGTQRSGVGTALLRHVQARVDTPILIGTWAAASWAIDFYQRNGFTVIAHDEKERLLRTYWSIPLRQIATSVVLADAQGLARLRGLA